MAGGRPRYPEILTPAELRVFEAIQRGLGNAAIADELGISLNTVKYHVSNILGKLNVSSREELAAMRRPRRSWGWLFAPRVLIGASVGVAAVGCAAVAITIFGADDGAATLPTPEPSGQIAFVTQDASDSSTHVAFVSAADDCTATAACAAPQAFPTLEGFDLQVSPVWSPDGSMLTYIGVPAGAVVQAGQSGRSALIVVSSGVPHQIEQYVSVLPAEGVITRPEWRPDGGLIEFTTQDFLASTIAPGGSERKDQILGCETGSWALGGQVGLCSSFHNNAPERGPTDIWVSPNEGGDFRWPEDSTASLIKPNRITVDGVAAQPVMSDDGAWIAWWAYPVGGGTPEVYTAPVQPEGMIVKEKMLVIGTGEQPSFRPGSHDVLFSSATSLAFPPVLSHGEVCVFDPDKAKVRWCSKTGGSNDWPSWSPDGNWITFVSDHDEAHGELYMMRADGKDLRRLTFNEVAESMPDWAP